MAEVIHETVFFSGRVQGVGFRYQTLQVARGFEVAGYVQNLPDGRVRVEVEGRTDEVDAFVIAVQEQMSGYVRETARQRAVRTPMFQGFAIR